MAAWRRFATTMIAFVDSSRILIASHRARQLLSSVSEHYRVSGNHSRRVMSHCELNVLVAQCYGRVSVSDSEPHSHPRRPTRHVGCGRKPFDSLWQAGHAQNPDG